VTGTATGWRSCRRYRIAADNLGLGRTVVADSCNPIEITRRAWERVAMDAGVSFVNVEVVCSDAHEHRTRVESRAAEVPGLRLPTWSDVQRRSYDDWSVERWVVDTAGRSESDVLRELLAKLQPGEGAMAQVKVYGLRASIDAHRASLSDAIHASVMEALQYPPEKRFHRFLALESGDFVFPRDRTERYTIIEISMFAGRSVDAKKALVRALYENVARGCGIEANDLEITIIETPRENWGIRGVSGDELGLGYRVEV
jgi:phenylpyruvate tautomerase PptA (4-oxalocrotonate tautomerase family)